MRGKRAFSSSCVNLCVHTVADIHKEGTAPVRPRVRGDGLTETTRFQDTEWQVVVFPEPRAPLVWASPGFQL